MNKEFWRAAAIRAARTTAQCLLSNIPAGLVVTPVMIEKLDISMMYIVAAWILTGLLGGLTSLLTSIVTGLPEVKG